MFLLFWIRQQFSSLTASHSWRLFLVVCCLLGVIDATSINNRAVFSEKSFSSLVAKVCKVGEVERKGRKEGRKGLGKKRTKEKKNERKGKQRKEEERKKEREKLETFHHACFSPFRVPLAKMNSFSLLDHLEKDADRYRYGCGYGYRYWYRYRHSIDVFSQTPQELELKELLEKSWKRLVLWLFVFLNPGLNHLLGTAVLIRCDKTDLMRSH